MTPLEKLNIVASAVKAAYFATGEEETITWYYQDRISINVKADKKALHINLCTIEGEGLLGEFLEKIGVAAVVQKSVTNDRAFLMAEAVIENLEPVGVAS